MTIALSSFLEFIMDSFSFNLFNNNMFYIFQESPPSYDIFREILDLKYMNEGKNKDIFQSKIVKPSSDVICYLIVPKARKLELQLAPKKLCLG